jgi:hypothetical protein
VGAPRQRDPEERDSFLRGGARPQTEEVVDYIDADRKRFGARIQVA